MPQTEDFHFSDIDETHHMTKGYNIIEYRQLEVCRNFGRGLSLLNTVHMSFQDNHNHLAGMRSQHIKDALENIDNNQEPLMLGNSGF